MMKVYFYHTQDLNMIQKKWKEGRFPGHFLYGATHLPQYGVDVIMHKHKAISSRFSLMLYVTRKILTCHEHFDAIYATHFNGLELIITLRALHLYRKPIIIWHHQPIVKSDSSMREMFARLFYKGIDHMFFFSERLIEESLKSEKANEERMQVCHWGADLENYDRIMADNADVEPHGYISTGKEKRDMPTLIRAFSATGQELSIFVAYNACGDNYLEILNDLRPSSNVQVNFIKGLIPNELALKVWQSKCVVICCQETNYTVGLTTLVEALALGKPVICTRNTAFPIDIDKEGIGISVSYYDSVGWEKAIRHMTANPEEAEEMGKRARKLAEKIYNLDNCTKEVAEAIKKFEKVKEEVKKPVAAPKAEEIKVAERPQFTPAPQQESAYSFDFKEEGEDVSAPAQGLDSVQPQDSSYASQQPSMTPEQFSSGNNQSSDNSNQTAQVHQKPSFNTEKVKEVAAKVWEILVKIGKVIGKLSVKLFKYIRAKLPILWAYIKKGFNWTVEAIKSLIDKAKKQ